MNCEKHIWSGTDGANFFFYNLIFAIIDLYMIWLSNSDGLTLTKNYTKLAEMKKNISCLTAESEHEYKWVLIEEFSGFNDTIASKCLMGDATELLCSAFWRYQLEYGDDDRRSTKYYPTAKGPCVFPFRYKNVTYNTCTKVDTKYNWCATVVDAQSNFKGGWWGYCNESCPTKDITNKPWFIILLITIGSLTLLISLILLGLYCTGTLRCRYFKNTTTNHFIISCRDCCFKKCYSYEHAKQNECFEME